jgi:two-component system response regulator AtoC
MPSQHVLIIDDEDGVRTSLQLVLEDEGYRVRTVGDAESALRLVKQDAFDVVVTDVRMPGRDGLSLLPDLVRHQPEATILVMSAFGDVEQALEAVRGGAWDYLAKPFEPAELLLAIRKAEEREGLRRENRRLRAEIADGRGTRALVAASSAMRDVVELVERAAEFKTTVLVTGESGVGKEVVARTIHDLSERAERPFIAVNCGAIPESLIEAELFGHSRGAFTGADSARRGLFREADGGTLFLDEIGELPLAMQVKLLRVLQEEEVRPIGEPKPVAVDVRILTATARDLEQEIAAGRFRSDLYYRLNVFGIRIPPLRERAADVPLLVDHLLQALSRRIGKTVREVEPEAMERLSRYAWPGNVRELENMLERAVILARGDCLLARDLPFLAPLPLAVATAAASEPAASGEAEEDLSVKRRVRSLEERLIRRALERTGGNRTRAARILELSPRALQYKLKEYGIAGPQPENAGGR